MKQKWFALILSALALPLINLNNTVNAHVVPADQLRNKVYLNKTEALKSVFKGIRKLKHRKGHLKDSQVQRIEALTGQSLPSNRVNFYLGTQPDGGKLFAFIETAESNSHPPSKAVVIILVDGKATIRDVQIMEYKGPQRAEIISPEFLNQFVGKTAESDFSTITSNRGNTLPVRSLAEAVNRAAARVQALTRER
jgi:hypothetical protein